MWAVSFILGWCRSNGGAPPIGKREEPAFMFPLGFPTQPQSVFYGICTLTFSKWAFQIPSQSGRGWRLVWDSPSLFLEFVCSPFFSEDGVFLYAKKQVGLYG